MTPGSVYSGWAAVGASPALLAEAKPKRSMVARSRCVGWRRGSSSRHSRLAVSGPLPDLPRHRGREAQRV